MSDLPRWSINLSSRHSLRSLAGLALVSGWLITGSPLPLAAQTVTFAGATPSVNFGNVNLCATGKATPAPCTETLALTYNVTASGTLGTPRVVTGGQPDLDFLRASGSTCTGAVKSGASCIVNVQFTPLLAGTRPGGVLIVDESGKVLAKTFVYGTGLGPQLGFYPGTQVIVPFSSHANSLGVPVSDAYFPSLALDGAGDLFVGGSLAGDSNDGGVAELPAAGGGEISIPFVGLGNPIAIAVDGAGDVFAADYPVGQILERPAGGGPQITFTLPAADDGILSITSDPAGDVFASGIAFVVKLPAGGGAPVALPFSSSDGAPFHVLTDGAGDLFVTDGQNLNELPAGSSTVTHLTPVGSLFAIDSLADLFTEEIAHDDVTLYETPSAGGAAILLPAVQNILGPDPIIAPNGDFFYENDRGKFTITDLQRSQPSNLNFGPVAMGSTATLPLILTNTGTGNLIVAPSLVSANYKIVSMTPENCAAGIAPSQLCTLDIEYSPSAPGAHDEFLTLEANVAKSPTVEVKLQGTDLVSAPVLSIASGVYAGSQAVSIADAAPGAKVYYTTNGTIPTAASALYTAPITISSTARVTAVAILAGASSATATAAYTIIPASAGAAIDFSEGFSRAGSSIQVNGSAGLGADLVVTTAGNNEAGSAFYLKPVNIQSFATDFTFQVLDPIADGFTFTIQNEGSGALGGEGGSLGYSEIGTSVAIKFDLFDNDGEGPQSTGLYVNGARPTVPAINLAGTGINLHSGDSFLVQITYNGTVLDLTLTDLATQVTWSHSFPMNIPAIVGATTAYVGFTGGTGGEVAHQQILSWTYVAGAPGTPAPASMLPATPDFPTVIGGNGLVVNGTASLAGNSLELTNGVNQPGSTYAYTLEAASAFYANLVNIRSFSTAFTFQLTGPVGNPRLAEIGDGFTFVVQNAGLAALGSYGKSLGYATLSRSVAIKFDLYDNAGEGQNSTGLYTGGALPTVPAIDLTGTGIDLHSGNIISASLVYNGTDLTLALMDTVTLATWSHAFSVDIPAAVGGNTAFVGFTGGSGQQPAIQKILTWTFSNP